MQNSYKLIIAGGRDFYNTDENLLAEHYKIGVMSIVRLREKYNIEMIISGKAKGADRFGEIYANTNNIKLKEFPADWERYGKRAGMVRNKEMAEEGDILLAFWNGKSKGTKNMIETMKKLKKPVFIEYYDKEEDYAEW